jgi:hypothetical protein
MAPISASQLGMEHYGQSHGPYAGVGLRSDGLRHRLGPPGQAKRTLDVAAAQVDKAELVRMTPVQVAVGAGH